MTAPAPGEEATFVSDNVEDRERQSQALSVWGVFALTAVTLDISLQVLRRPLSSRSLCWMTLCMAAGLSEPISISWLADNRAVSRVCWWNTQNIESVNNVTTCQRNLSERQTFAQLQGLLRHAGLFHHYHLTWNVTFSLYNCWIFSSCVLRILSSSHILLSLVWWWKKRGVTHRFSAKWSSCRAGQQWTYIDIHFFWQTCVNIFPVVIWTQLLGEKWKWIKKPLQNLHPH